VPLRTLIALKMLFVGTSMPGLTRTSENVGKDVNGNGAIDITANPIEVNPNYDFRVDRAGRRFRIEEQLVWRVTVTASLNF